MPGYFQFPIHYGNFRAADQLEPDLNITWGAPILIGDMQAGLPGTRMPDGSLILRDGRAPATTSIAATGCPQISSATTCTAKPSAGSSAG